MATNRNQLRDDAAEFAVLVSRLFGSDAQSDPYKEKLFASVISLGSALSSLKYSRDEISLVRRLNLALDACSEISFVSKVLLLEGKSTEENYKLVKKSIGTIERRISACLSE